MPHRTLKLTTPHLQGNDVVLLQRTVNGWLRRWNVPRRLDQDGEYGMDTRAMTLLVCYGLGIAKAETVHGISPGIRIKLRDPARRTLIERRRGDDRAHWRARLKLRFERQGAALAVAYANRMAQKGVHETGGANRGPLIDKWNRAVGIPPGPNAFWCGSFANACLVAAGFEPMRFMAFCPHIEEQARSGRDGWRWKSASATPQPGWLALFTHGGVAGHVEVVVKPGKPLVTIGGNTSVGDGSPNNGGQVARHDFSTYRGMPLRGFALPPYH